MNLSKMSRVVADDLDNAVTNAAPALTLLDGRDVFVAGGTGYVGMWLMGTLLHANRLGLSRPRIVVLSRNVDVARKKLGPLAVSGDAVFVQGDIQHLREIEGSYDYVIHGAADVTTPRSGDEHIFGGVSGVRNVLEKVQIQPSGRLLYLSSGAVYGDATPGPEGFVETDLSELSIASDHASYGIAKLASENMLFATAAIRPFDIVIARLFAQIGPGLPLDRQFAFGNFLCDVSAGRPIVVRGDGATRRSYLYGSDLASWLINLLVYGKGNEAYNVGSERSVSILELAEMVRVGAGVPDHPIKIMGNAEASPASTRYIPSTLLARNSLGLREHVTLESAIDNMFLHLREPA